MSFQLEFESRPHSVLPDLRLYRRLAILCISLSKCCRAKTASFKQLHFINSLFLDEKFRELFIAFRSNEAHLGMLSPSVDPYLNRCVNYGIGANLIGQKDVKAGFRVTLLKEGELFVKQLKKQEITSDIFNIASNIGLVADTEISSAIRMGR